MEEEKREKLGQEISACILKNITELEKAMARDCLDYGQLTRQEKENLIDEWLFFFLFRVDMLLFNNFAKDERVSVKETILHSVFAPLHQMYDQDKVIEIIKRSLDRFSEYVEVYKKRNRQIDVYSSLKKHLAEINMVILEGTEGPKNALYSFLVQKNAEDALTKEVRAIIQDSKQARSNRSID